MASREESKLARRVISLLETYAETRDDAAEFDDDEIEELVRNAEDSDEHSTRDDDCSREVVDREEQQSGSRCSPTRVLAMSNRVTITICGRATHRGVLQIKQKRNSVLFLHEGEVPVSLIET